MTWSNGRQLDSTNVGGMNLSYSYNADGQRTSKSRSAYYTDEYVYYGTQLSTLIRNGVGYKHSLTFIYDDNGQALGFYYDTNLNDSNPGTKYYYVCNAQGDVLQLRDHTNAPVANYYYDSWGKLLGITDANGNAITAFNSVAVLNPIRYRGYFYDTETGFYYLNSRYYDPQIGRFINADGYVSTGQEFLDYNMFLYCGNNPVMLVDPSGTSCHIFEGGRFGPACPTDKNGYCPVCKAQECCLSPTSSNKTTQELLTDDEKVLIATIAAEATVTAAGKPVSSQARQAMANVALNRVGQREWARYATVAQICEFTGFDGYGNANYQACMEYLNNRDGSNQTYESIIWDVKAAYKNDITNGCQLYYTPAAMANSTGIPNWNFSILEEVMIPGVDPYYEGRFYKYK